MEKSHLSVSVLCFLSAALSLQEKRITTHSCERHDQTARRQRPVCSAVTNSQPSKLLQSDMVEQKDRGGKAQSLLTHTPCVRRANTLSSLGSDSNLQKLSHVRAHPAAQHVDRANTVCRSTGHVYDLGGVDECHRLPSLSSSLSLLMSQLQTKFSCPLLSLSELAFL